VYNSNMRKIWVTVLFLAIVTACTNAPINVSNPTVTATTKNPPSTKAASATASPLPSLTAEILPTATPVLYSVVRDDTLTSIARKFNLSLDELLAANPAAGSQVLTPGLVLTIPSRPGTPIPPATTPVPVSIQQIHCYPVKDDSLYCLALVQNEYERSLQNLSVLISLQTSTGTTIVSLSAYAPLDIIPPGKIIPFSALFTGVIPIDYYPQAVLMDSSWLADTDSHYLSVSLSTTLVEIDWGGLSARVSGKAMLGPGSADASHVWILAVAYDQYGNLIGFRRWETTTPLSSGEILPFNFLVSSLGPEIDHVEFLAEASR
jgi:LysM repeat protein